MRLDALFSYMRNCGRNVSLYVGIGSSKDLVEDISWRIGFWFACIDSSIDEISSGSLSMFRRFDPGG
jgi:hypothetical protein